MAHINDIPEAVTGAGEGFDYVDPPRFASVTLVNAPLDPSHRNIGLNRTAYDTFIDAEVDAGRAHVETNLNIQDPEHSLDLPIPYEEASTFYNYGRLIIDGRPWYIFYTAVYLNKTSTRFLADIDEIASYTWQLGYSQIERGHVAVAASLTDTYGDQYLTAPEPFDAPPVRGVLNATLLGSSPDSWTVLAVSANDLRGGSGFPFWDRHVLADEIGGAARLATSATLDTSGDAQTEIPDANYPWSAYSGPVSAPVIDTISPGHSITNPGGTVASAWEWHIENNDGRGGVDWNYNFETFTAPAPGVVDHFNVTGVGMVVRLTLDTPAVRTSARQPHGDQPGPMVAIWFQHCSAAVDGPCAEGDIIGTSGDGGGLYAPHLHVHGAIDHSTVSGADNRCNFWGFKTSGGIPTDNDIFVPKVEASPVSTIDGISAGGGCYLFTMEGFARYMTIMQGAPWVTSGIIDVRLVPSWAVTGGGDATYSATTPSLDPSDDMWAEAADIPNFRAQVVSAVANPDVLDGWRDDALSAVGATGWRKLLTAQFADLLVGNGDTLRSFRPDQWQHDGIGFQAVTGAAHGDPSIRLIPSGYNRLGSQMGVDTPVGGQAGLAHTGYGLAASQVASQDIAPYLAAYNAQLTWATTNKNRELAISLALTEIQLNAGVQGISTVLGGAKGAAGGALGATPGNGGAGAIGGGASALLGAIGTLATAQIQSNNAITILDISNNSAFDIGAFSLGMSGLSSVQAFDTWYQSLFSSSGGGSTHHVASGWRAIIAQAFDVVISMPTTERVKMLVSEWSKFGYMIEQAFKPTRLDPMTKMSYWKTADAAILGAVPQARRETIAQAFDQGTTVWNSIADIGTDVTNTNNPRTGISY